jgi:hypothetical protein
VPITVNCPACGKVLKAPDNMAGKVAKCPGCSGRVSIPEAETEIFDAEVESPMMPILIPQPASNDLLNMADPPTPAGAVPAEGGDQARRPCPACGEMIVNTAAKCRFCGEIFDPELKRAEEKKNKSPDDDMTTGDWVLAVLCSGIGCIMGIVFLIQGKKKGGKMLGVSFLMAIVWNILKIAVQSAANQR